jgi:Domain of unknown function (DUF4295)
MAKKVVATLKKQLSADEKVVKVIKSRRSEKSGAYTFREEFVTANRVDEFFKS